MIYSWLKRRRRRTLWAQPFPTGWEQHLERNVTQYSLLENTQRKKLQQCVQIVIAEKYWEGCNGLQITDEIKVTIAGQASLLLLGFDDEHFEHVKTVLVYPNEYFVQQTTWQPGGVVDESMSVRLGEVWYRGPVILAWSSVLKSGQMAEQGQNVVLHEFAHVLDMRTDMLNGTPMLQNAEQYRTWQQVMMAEYHQLIDDSQRGRVTLIDQYGVTSPAEFFAVATECFFEQPSRMQKRHCRLYELLCGFYRQDPASRLRVALGQQK